MSAGRARKLARQRTQSWSRTCALCGKERAFRRGDSCQECQLWLAQYDNGAQYNRNRLLIRQLHALQRRAEQELPLFEGGKLCV